MSARLDGSPYCPYVFPPQGPSPEVSKVLGAGGVSRRLGALKASLQELEDSERIEVFLGDKGLGVRVGS